MGVFTLNNDFEQLIKRLSQTDPKEVEGLNNTSYFYYFNKLLKMIYAIFKFDNIPDNWNMPYFKEHLFIDGVVCVTDTAAGVIPLMTGRSGVNIYGQPTDFIISNPVLGTITGKIDIDGIMVYTSMIGNEYQSLVPLISRYATLLSEVDGSLQTTLINSRVAHVFSASSNAQMKTMQRVYDDISKGKPAVFIRKNPDESNDHALFNNVKNSFIGIELLEVKRSILNEFMSEIGINNANTQKRERLITGEVDSNKAELSANIYMWYENLKTCIDKVNNKYNLNIIFDYNYDVLEAWQKDGGVE